MSEICEVKFIGTDTKKKLQNHMKKSLLQKKNNYHRIKDIIYKEKMCSIVIVVIYF